MTHRLVAAAAVAAAVLAPAAAAHSGGGAAKGYRSQVVAVVPANPAVHIQVLDSDDRLQLHVDGNAAVIIDGYQDEPYLRFDSTGVYVNARSPAGYLNDDRYGQVKLPDNADAKAAPEWDKVGPPHQPYEWHDHRIHWMSTDYPRPVAANKSVPHHIFDWTVPGTANGKPLAIKGTLDYKPLPGQKFPTILIVPFVLLVVGGIVLLVVRNRPKKPPEQPLKPEPKKAIPRSRAPK